MSKTLKYSGELAHELLRLHDSEEEALQGVLTDLDDAELQDLAARFLAYLNRSILDPEIQAMYEEIIGRVIPTLAEIRGRVEDARNRLVQARDGSLKPWAEALESEDADAATKLSSVAPDAPAAGNRGNQLAAAANGGGSGVPGQSYTAPATAPTPTVSTPPAGASQQATYAPKPAGETHVKQKPTPSGATPLVEETITPEAATPKPPSGPEIRVHHKPGANGAAKSSEVTLTPA